MLREKAVKKQRSASALPEISAANSSVSDFLEGKFNAPRPISTMEKLQRQPGRSTQRGPDEYQEQLNQVFDNLKADKKNS
jgi:hypothetical protein